jgi:hypothetical protein
VQDAVPSTCLVRQIHHVAKHASLFTVLQVEGCAADLSLEKVYCQKKAVCSQRLKVCHTIRWQNMPHVAQA